MNDRQAKDLYRADQAKRIAEEPLFQEAMATIKAGIRETLFDLPIEAVDQRERLVMMDKIRQQFESIFVNAMTNGEVVRHELLAEEKARGMFEQIKEKVRAYVG